MKEAIQQTIKDYTIIRSLAQGGFGVTFLAEDSNQKRLVIKQLRPIAQNDLESSLTYFIKECDRLKAVGHHDRIPTFIEYFEEGGQHHIVQQYIPGQNLLEEARGRDRYSETEVIDLLLDCLETLDFIHSKNLIHRDIKPANLIRRQIDSKICLVDFGAAKAVSETILAKTSHTLIGSVSYSAPEQMIGHATYASDLYALGATCLFLLTGQEPTDLYSIAEDQWCWQETYQTSPEFAEVLNKLIHRATSKRYTTAKEARNDVADVCDRIRKREKNEARAHQIQTLRRHQLVRTTRKVALRVAAVAALGVGIWQVTPVITSNIEKLPTIITTEDQPPIIIENDEPKPEVNPFEFEGDSKSIEELVKSKMIAAGYPAMIVEPIPFMLGAVKFVVLASGIFSLGFTYISFSRGERLDTSRLVTSGLLMIFVLIGPHLLIALL